jgi:Cdc6-like AAA superfamily ATPase
LAIEPKKVLFCPGIPGAGKTVMSSIVIDFLNTKFEKDSDVKVAFLFCSYRSQHAQKSDDLLSSILRQLAYRNSGELCSHVEDLYKARLSADWTALDHEKVMSTLSHTARSYKRIYLVVDGLDEHFPSNPEERRQLLSELFKLQHDLPVNILVTSRFVSEIMSDFEGYPSKEIRAVDEDVLNYANTRIPLLVRGTITSYPGTQDEIRKNIVTSADGM